MERRVEVYHWVKKEEKREERWWLFVQDSSSFLLMIGKRLISKNLFIYSKEKEREVELKRKTH